MKNTLEEINSRLANTEWINDLEGRLVEINPSEQQKIFLNTTLTV